MIRLVHTLGGCGGTVLTRCLGVLPGVVVFSEINPAAVKLFKHFDPLYQDSNWHHLLQAADSERFSKMDLRDKANFNELVNALLKSAGASGKHLLLRDFNYIDFVGVPFVEMPAGRLTIYDALPNEVSTKAVAFIREPIDQFISLCKHVELLPDLTPSVFLAAYVDFLDQVVDLPIYKYEEFVDRPAQQLQVMCADLSLPFVSSFLEDFHGFDSVTGDFERMRDTKISAPKKKDIPYELVQEFTGNDNYKLILAKTGYAQKNYSLKP